MRQETLDLRETQYGNARERYQQALALYRTLPSQLLGEANTLRALGGLSWPKGDFDTAAQYFQQAADLYHDIELLRGEAVMKAKFAQLRLDQGQPREAVCLIWEALQYFEAHQLTEDVNVTRSILRRFASRIENFSALWQEISGTPVPD